MKKEGQIAGYIRLFLEQPRTDEEVVAYLQGWQDAGIIIREALARQQGAKP